MPIAKYGRWKISTDRDPEIGRDGIQYTYGFETFLCIRSQYGQPYALLHFYGRGKSTRATTLGYYETLEECEKRLREEIDKRGIK